VRVFIHSKRFICIKILQDSCASDKVRRKQTAPQRRLRKEGDAVKRAGENEGDKVHDDEDKVDDDEDKVEEGEVKEK
jgi:hypothetical protein